MLPMRELIKHAAAVMEFLDNRSVKAPDACVIMAIGMGTILRESNKRREFIGHLELAWDALDDAMTKKGEHYDG